MLIIAEFTVLTVQGANALQPQRPETHLKYAVEVQIPRATPMVGMLEPVMERVVYEDIPFNLAAVKQRVEEVRLQRRIAELEDQGVLLSSKPFMLRGRKLQSPLSIALL